MKYGGGYGAFCERYGDYYVTGYRLGGETGLLVSTSGYSFKQVETFGVTVTVEVLFVEVSTSYSKDFQSYASGKTLKLLGYDTVDGLNWNTYTTSGDFMTFYNQKQDIVLKSGGILERVQKSLDKQQLHESHYLTNQQCDELIRSGLVIELMLLPMANLRDVARWTTNTDII